MIGPSLSSLWSFSVLVSGICEPVFSIQHPASHLPPPYHPHPLLTPHPPYPPASHPRLSPLHLGAPNIVLSASARRARELVRWACEGHLYSHGGGEGVKISVETGGGDAGTLPGGGVWGVRFRACEGRRDGAREDDGSAERLGV